MSTAAANPSFVTRTWNDADAAQKLMRERQQLDDSIAGVKRLEQAMNDNIELIEMGEEEGDESVVKELAKLGLA